VAATERLGGASHPKIGLIRERWHETGHCSLHVAFDEWHRAGGRQRDQDRIPARKVQAGAELLCDVRR